MERVALVSSFLKHTRDVTHDELGGVRLRLITRECELYTSDARSLPDGYVIVSHNPGCVCVLCVGVGGGVFVFGLRT